MDEEKEHNDRLISMVRSSSGLMAILSTVRSLSLTSWCVGAGVVRSLVWDHLQHFETPSPLSDIDIVYFEEGTARGRDCKLESHLTILMPLLSWDVTNQTKVHE